MKPLDDERRPLWQGTGAGVEVVAEATDTSSLRRGAQVPVVPAVPALTQARSGRLSWVLTVVCPFDPGHGHVHRVRVGTVGGRRRAACAAGSYVLVVVRAWPA